MRLVLGCLTLALVLSGCFGETNSIAPGMEENPDWAVRAIFADVNPDETGNVVDHDHHNISLHQGLTTPNFQIIGHDSMLGEYHAQGAGMHWCGDLSNAEGERRIAVATSYGTDIALTVLDVTNPTMPMTLGELVLPYAFTYDAAVFEDASYAVLVTNPDLRVDAQAPRDQPAIFRDACSGEERVVESNVDETPFGYSTVLVDLSDPTNPVIEDVAIHQARNMHSVTTAIIDGQHYVLTSGLQAVPCAVPGLVPGVPTGEIPNVCGQMPRLGNLLSYFQFYTIEAGIDGAMLSPYALYSGGNFADFDPEIAALSNGHVDGILQKHPATGKLVASLAHWDGGYIFIQLDGPNQITHLATWGEANDAGFGKDMWGNAHGTLPFPELIDGKHYTLVGQEVVGNLPYRSTGQVVLMDTTDPTIPMPVARWTMPVEVEWSGLVGYSTHYFVVEGDTMFVSLYHGGVWAVDMSKENWPEMPSLGVFMPATIPDEPAYATTGSPLVLEVLNLGNNQLLVFDGDTGAYAVEWTGVHEDVPVAAPWTNDAWI